MLLVHTSVHQVRMQSRDSQTHPENSFMHFINTSFNLYLFKKKLGYLMAFTDYMRQKALGENLLTHDLILLTWKRECPGYFFTCREKASAPYLRNALPDCFEDIVKKSTSNAPDETAKKDCKTFAVLAQSLTLHSLRRSLWCRRST